MSTVRPDELREIVREAIEKFRKKHGTNGNPQDLSDSIKHDSRRHWDADDLRDIDDFLKKADVDIEVNVNFPDDEYPHGFMA